MRQRQRYQKQGTPQRVTKAVTHIRLIEANPGKLAALDTLAPASDQSQKCLFVARV